MKLKIEIKGRIPAKSSQRCIIRNRKTNKPMVISSPHYNAFERHFCERFDFNCMSFGKDDRLSVTIDVQADSNRQDIDSYPKTIFDCMEKSGLIYNDNRIDELFVKRTVIKNKKKLPVTTVTIEDII